MFCPEVQNIYYIFNPALLVSIFSDLVKFIRNSSDQFRSINDIRFNNMSSSSGDYLVSGATLIPSDSLPVTVTMTGVIPKLKSVGVRYL